MDVPKHKSIIQAEGFEEDGGENSRSPKYNAYMKGSSLDYVGRANRKRGPVNKIMKCETFEQFYVEKKLKIPLTHCTIQKSVEGEYKSAAKYGKNQPNLDEQAWALSREYVIKHFGVGCMKSSRVVSQEVARQEMNKQSSPGYPHNIVYRTKAKMYADVKHSSITNDYFAMIARSQEEQEWKPIWMVSEKVELRPLDKIAANSIRTFTASPVEHSEALNRMCLDQNNRFYATHGQTWSFVGANKYNGGFHTLYNMLRKHSNAFELDESQYDSSLFARALAEMADIRFEFLHNDDKTPENHNRFLNLYESIIHTLMVMQNGELLQKHTGNPSGSANTIVDNTIILFRLLSYAWIVANKENRKKNKLLSEILNSPDVNLRNSCNNSELLGSYTEFMGNVSAALNGDDIAMTVSNKYVDVFNATTIGGIWSGIGITTTAPDYSLGQKVENITFLSQSFKFVDNIWMPAPATGKVLSSLMYGSEIKDVRWDLLRACALRVDSWANEEVRPIIDGYIDYLNDHYHDIYMLDTEVKVGDTTIQMSDIRNMYKSDLWISHLYNRYESASVDEQNEQVKMLKLISLATAVEGEQSEENINIFPNHYKDSRIVQSLKMPKQTKLSNQRVIKLVSKKIRNAKPRRVKGKGGYFTDLIDKVSRPFMDNTQSKGAVNRVARMIGTEIGNKIPIPGAGTALGNVGSWISRIFGSGQYTIKSNSLMHPSGQGIVGGMNSSSPPSFGSAKTGSDIIFSHREYVQDINSSVAFNQNTFALNPGNPTLFPWMSQIASLYEEYEFLGLIFEYKSTSGTSITSAVPGMGSVIMATEYDTYDPGFSSKRAMEAAEFSSSGVPYDNFLHAVECDPSRNPLKRLFVVPNITVSSATQGDQRFSVLGNFTIATQGQQADGVPMGELWVSYHMRLSRPILEPSIHTSAFTQYSSWNIGNNGGVTYNSNDVYNGLPFGIIGSAGTVGANHASLTITNTNNYTGKYLIALASVNYSSTITFVNSIDAAVFTNCNISTVGEMTENAFWSAEEGNTSLNTPSELQTYIINFQTTGAVFQLPLSTATGQVLQLNVVITPIASVLENKKARLPTSVPPVKNGKDEVQDNGQLGVSKRLSQLRVDPKQSSLKLNEIADQMKIDNFTSSEIDNDGDEQCRLKVVYQSASLSSALLSPYEMDKLNNPTVPPQRDVVQEKEDEPEWYRVKRLAEYKARTLGNNDKARSIKIMSD